MIKLLSASNVYGVSFLITVKDFPLPPATTTLAGGCVFSVP